PSGMCSTSALSSISPAVFNFSLWQVTQYLSSRALSDLPETPWSDVPAPTCTGEKRGQETTALAPRHCVALSFPSPVAMITPTESNSVAGTLIGSSNLALQGRHDHDAVSISQVRCAPS